MVYFLSLMFVDALCGINPVRAQGRSLSWTYLEIPRAFSVSPLICCSVAKLCLTLCDPLDCSTPGFLVLHRLPEFAQIHVH